MNLSRIAGVFFLLSAWWIAVPLVAADQPPTGADAIALFDRGVDHLGKDALAAKSSFTKAAACFEEQAALTNAQQMRGVAFYNAGVAHHLAGDRGRAVLNFRRAELLAPLTAGLHEHLAAARAEARDEAASTGAAAPPSAGDLATSASRSYARQARWYIFVASWAVVWIVILLRTTLHPLSRLRPSRLVLAIAALCAIISAGAFALLARDDLAARHEAVILTETQPRSEPDDLVGKPAGVSLKPGREITILQERSGGNGMPWWCVRSREEVGTDSSPGVWIPASAGAKVVDDNTPVLSAH